MKNKIIIFLGFIFVVAGISAVGTGYLMESRMNHRAHRIAAMVKSQALMVRQRGEALESLAADLSASPSRESMQTHAETIRKQAEQMKRYATDLIEKMQTEDPEDALTDMAEVNLVVPENLNVIKSQNEKIETLQRSQRELKQTIITLQNDLYRCRSMPRPPLNSVRP